MFFSRKNKPIAVSIVPTSELQDAIKSQTIMRVAALLLQVHNWHNPPPGTSKLSTDKYIEKISDILQKFEALEFDAIRETFITHLPPTGGSSYLGCALAILSNKTNDLIALGLDKKDIEFIYEDLGICDGEKRGKNILLYKILKDNLKENLDDTPEHRSVSEASVKEDLLSHMLTKLVKEQEINSDPSAVANNHRRFSPV